MAFFTFIGATVSLHAQSPWAELDWMNATYLQWLTNSVFVAGLVAGAIVLWARKATRRMQIVPVGRQNLFESIVELLYDNLETIVGKKMVGKTFSLLASLFIFILVANWFSLLPGVGSVGWGTSSGVPLTLDSINVPLLRPATADLNMTLALASFFMIMWLYWTFRTIGVGGFIKHTFGVKGGLKGVMAIFLCPIFFFVGIIELISMAFRPISLSLRLFGNIFAGENLLVTMINLGKDLHLPVWIAYLMGVLVPIPFYFLEILVGVLQALVFTLLCAVYIQLAVSDDGDH